MFVIPAKAGMTNIGVSMTFYWFSIISCWYFWKTNCHLERRERS